MHLTCFLVGALLAVGHPGEVTHKRVVYARPAQHPLGMTLVLPKDDGARLRPAVVLIHGGSWFFGTRRQLHWYARQLAREGYVTAAISYRMMPGHRFPACLHDCKAAVRWLRLHADELRIDPDRIAAMGNSAGGHLAGLLATTRAEDGCEGVENPGASSAVQAAVMLYGVSDLSYYKSPKGYIGLGGLTRLYIRWFLRGGQEQNYAAASPVHYVDRGTCPILLVHGTRDHFVPYRQAARFWQDLRRLGVPTRMITVPYGHAFDFFHHPARRAVFAEMLAFLDQHLRDGSDRGGD